MRGSYRIPPQIKQVKKGGEIEDMIREEEPFIGSKSLTDPDNLNVKSASIELTHHTLQSIATSPINRRIPESEQLTKKEWLKVIDKLADEGVENLTITGGEPTLHPSFSRILGYSLTRFDNVTVQTRGTTDQNLSDFNCTVSVPIDYPNPIHNNQLRRMTDPEEYRYDADNGLLVPKQHKTCGFCGREFPRKAAAVKHVSSSHETEATEVFEDATDIQVDSYSEMKEYDEFDYSMILEREDPIPLQEREAALYLAVSKLEKVAEQGSNPLVIRTNLFSNNDLLHVISLAQELGAGLALKPLYPAFQRDELLEQVPAPNRMREAMTIVRDLNRSINNRVWMESPLYKAWSYEVDLETGFTPLYHRDQYLEWWKRGRISGVGVSQINILPDGTITPSRYIRDPRYNLGHIVRKKWGHIYEEMAGFNATIKSEDDHRPVQSFDIRQRSIAGDPNVYLNDPY